MVIVAPSALRVEVMVIVDPSPAITAGRRMLNEVASLFAVTGMHVQNIENNVQKQESWNKITTCESHGDKRAVLLTTTRAHDTDQKKANRSYVMVCALIQPTKALAAFRSPAQSRKNCKYQVSIRSSFKFELSSYPHDFRK